MKILYKDNFLLFHNFSFLIYMVYFIYDFIRSNYTYTVNKYKLKLLFFYFIYNGYRQIVNKCTSAIWKYFIGLYLRIKAAKHINDCEGNHINV